jgi:hypothetical protein
MWKRRFALVISATGLMVGIVQCDLTGTRPKTGPNVFERTGLIMHSIPHTYPKISFSALDTTCVVYTSSSYVDLTDYDVQLAADTIYAPYGAHLCGEIDEALRDTGISQVEMTCDSLPLLIGLMRKFGYDGDSWSTEIPYEKNRAIVIKCRNNRRVLLGTVGQYWGAYVRREYFWGVFNN